MDAVRSRAQFTTKKLHQHKKRKTEKNAKSEKRKEKNQRDIIWSS